MWQQFRTLLKATFTRNFDPLQHNIAQEAVNSGTRMMGYIRENGDVVLKPTNMPKKQTQSKTGTYNL